jgi:hypothetical protein
MSNENTLPARAISIKEIKAEELTFVCPITEEQSVHLLLERNGQVKKLINCLSCESFHWVDLAMLPGASTARRVVHLSSIF